jgi:hypothetical protein
MEASLCLVNDGKSVAYMLQNSIGVTDRQNQTLFLIYDGKSAAFVPQNSIGVMDGH